MTTSAPGPAAYLEEAAAILRRALKSAEDWYAEREQMHAVTPEDRRGLLEARVRVAEGFARLHEADRASGDRPEPEPQP